MAAPPEVGVVINDLRARIVMLLALLGTSAAAVGYLYGAPVVVALLPPAIALVAALRLTAGRIATYGAAGLSAAAFVFLQLTGTEQLHISFGSGALTLPTLLQNAGGLQALVGIAGLAAAMFVVELVARGLEAHEREVEAISRAAPLATVVRISVGPKPDGRRGQRIRGERLAELLNPELEELEEATILGDGRHGEVVVLLPGAADERAHALVRRLEAIALEGLERSLDSSVFVLEGHPVPRTARRAGAAIQPNGQPVETRSHTTTTTTTT